MWTDLLPRKIALQEDREFSYNSQEQLISLLLRLKRLKCHQEVRKCCTLTIWLKDSFLVPQELRLQIQDKEGRYLMHLWTLHLLVSHRRAILFISAQVLWNTGIYWSSIISRLIKWEFKTQRVRNGNEPSRRKEWKDGRLKWGLRNMAQQILTIVVISQ